MCSLGVEAEVETILEASSDLSWSISSSSVVSPFASATAELLALVNMDSAGHRSQAL